MVEPHHRPHRLVHLNAWQRQGIALVPAGLAGAGGAVWAPGIEPAPWLMAWIAYCLVYVGLVWRLAARLGAEETRQRAQREDPGAAMLFALVILAACTSLLAVVMNIQDTQSLQGWQRLLRLVLMGLSLAGAWLLIQCVFTLHYARVYYRSSLRQGEPDRGLAFPDGHDPDYLDLLYHSAVVGMTSQVSDVTVRSRPMRHLVLMHGVLAFGFNLVVLAAAVNVFASAGAH
ncbi:DUF1345 domain-containing protein [Hydrogenophaga sp.]|uniref:DUF1345 domain-containing protein n=1 Tax=Hydrogenophaga sp. TaxID=1904254 RepID=UPI00262B17D6|nr:DUF1345 domain-containing protein [Hydrogenophaga sp.]MCW5653944.1 DUF1345 domain-containing protein [Hydrogenophaga sp.]